ncbi:MAG: MOSC domain-containing protein [Actinomycetota bacterium]|nr:MOSC domain-containing protein [Actinomycetota bacterium]
MTDTPVPDASRAGTVAWISIAPVKSLALVALDRAELTLQGVPGDRAYGLVDDEDRLFNGKRCGELSAIRPVIDGGSTLALHLPDGAVVSGAIELGAAVVADVFGRPSPARTVEGPWSDALSTYAGRPVRLVRFDDPAPDRGATVSILSSAALDGLAEAAGAESIDPRRFRMTFGVDEIAAHAEDDWVGRRVRIGGAVVEVVGHVGRCAVTNLDPDTGLRDLGTLGLLRVTRRSVDATENLPFGVWGRVVTAGPVALGDPVAPATRGGAGA